MWPVRKLPDGQPRLQFHFAFNPMLRIHSISRPFANFFPGLGHVETADLLMEPSPSDAPRILLSANLHNQLPRPKTLFSSQFQLTQPPCKPQITNSAPHDTARMTCWECSGRKKLPMIRRASLYQAGTRRRSTVATLGAGERPTIITFHRNLESAGMKTEIQLPWAYRIFLLRRKK